MHIRTTEHDQQKSFASQKKHTTTLLTITALIILILVALPAIADTAIYTFNPEDIISVKVMNHPEFNVDQAVITPDGRINLPVAGEMTAVGKTLKQLENEITKAPGQARSKRYYRANRSSAHLCAGSRQKPRRI